MTVQFPKKFAGSGGGLFGGGESSAPQTTPDNLRSKDTVEFVLGISEGPIKGLTDGAKSFYIGDTPLQGVSGESNFGGFTLEEFVGEPDESVTPVLGGSTSSTTVGVNLVKDTPVTRAGSHNGIKYIDIRLLFQQLYATDDSGGTFNSTAKIRIEYKAASSATWTVMFGDVLSISGKTTSPYVKEIRITVPVISEPYDLRVTNEYPFSDVDPNHHCTVSWESFQEVVPGPIALHDVSAVHCVGEATGQFSSLPEFTGVYDGRTVRVPVNYNPVTRVYTGIWDGTFKIAYTNNPVWVLYDFVNHDRYGINKYFPMVLDKWDAYEAAVWCDEMVPDGQSGTQPRYTYNDLISDRRSGRELARYIAGVFNGIYYDDGNGTAHIVVDKDDAATAIYTPENVVDGLFEYSFTDITTRYNDITVTFINPDLDWAEDRIRIVDDPDADEPLIAQHQAKYGRIPLDFVAIGCTNEAEATRRGRYKFITATTEVATVNFTTNRLGTFNKPGDIILIADDTVGYGLHGRIKTYAIDTMQLRDPIYLEVGVTYTVTFQLSDGAGGFEIVERTVHASSPRGSVTSVQMTTALPTLPDKCVFSISSEGMSGAPKPFRVWKRVEADGDADNVEITAVEINRNKWIFSDAAITLRAITYTNINVNAQIPGPESVVFSEDADGVLTLNVRLPTDTYKWFNQEFDVWTRPVGDTVWTQATVINGIEIHDLPLGLREFAVLPRNIFGDVATIATVPIWTYSIGGQNVRMNGVLPTSVVSDDLVIDQNFHLAPAMIAPTTTFGTPTVTGTTLGDAISRDGLGESGLADMGIAGPDTSDSGEEGLGGGEMGGGGMGGP